MFQLFDYLAKNPCNEMPAFSRMYFPYGIQSFIISPDARGVIIVASSFDPRAYFFYDGALVYSTTHKGYIEKPVYKFSEDSKRILYSSTEEAKGNAPLYPAWRIFDCALQSLQNVDQRTVNVNNGWANPSNTSADGKYRLLQQGDSYVIKTSLPNGSPELVEAMDLGPKKISP